MDRGIAIIGIGAGGQGRPPLQRLGRPYRSWIWRIYWSRACTAPASGIYRYRRGRTGSSAPTVVGPAFARTTHVINNVVRLLAYITTG